jgi:hypothetical protein
MISVSATPARCDIRDGSTSFTMPRRGFATFTCRSSATASNFDSSSEAKAKLSPSGFTPTCSEAGWYNRQAPGSTWTPHQVDPGR